MGAQAYKGARDPVASAALGARASLANPIDLRAHGRPGELGTKEGSVTQEGLCRSATTPGAAVSASPRGRPPLYSGALLRECLPHSSKNRAASKGTRASS